MVGALERLVDKNNEAKRLRNEMLTAVVENTRPIPLELFDGNTPLSFLLGHDIQSSMDDYETSPEVRLIAGDFDTFLNESFEGTNHVSEGKEAIQKVIHALAYPFGVDTGRRIDDTGPVTVDGVRTVVSANAALLEQIKGFEDPLKRNLVKKLFATPTPVNQAD